MAENEINRGPNHDLKRDENRESERTEKAEPTKARKSSEAPSRLGSRLDSGKKEKWKAVNSHLDQALNQWNDLSEKMKDEVSPDQKQLQEVKNLLQDLKSKLDQF